MQQASNVKDGRGDRTSSGTGNECGPEINKLKSNIIIFNMKEKINEIEGIKISNKLKYLGITINLFQEHKQLIQEKGLKWQI